MKRLNEEVLPWVDQLVGEFGPVSLAEMDEVEFMNRTDTKFLMSSIRLPELLRQALKHYRILEIEGMRNFRYRTVYFDTKDFFLYEKHMKGKMNRYKIRHRMYEATGVSFLEIKLKNNKNRTIKWRIKNRLNNGLLDENGLAFLAKNIDIDPKELLPMVENHFNRVTLVSNQFKERVTIDFNLGFNSPQGIQCSLPFLAIVELKRDGFSCRSPFISLLKQYNIREGGFSKYCVGSALLYDLPNQNQLKPKFLKLKKIEHDNNLVIVA
ncbi:MAG: polyphosphate polymerase domain-containing protein [Breznakibacter sp.]